MFGFEFDKTETCTIEQVQFSTEELTGTCKLVSTNNSNIYTMTWLITNFPMETAGMPGSPYSIKFSWNILTESGSQDNAFDAITGHIIYKINSGTFPNFCPLGIRYGKYLSLGLNVKSGDKTQVLFKFNENAPSFVYMFN